MKIQRSTGVNGMKSRTRAADEELEERNASVN